MKNLKLLLALMCMLIITQHESYGQFQQTYGGPGNDEANSVLVTPNGFAVLGSTFSFGAGADDAYFLSVDGNGNLLSSRAIGGNRRDRGFGMLPSVNASNPGGFYLSFYMLNYPAASSFTSGNQDIHIVEVDASGNIIAGVYPQVYGLGGAEYGRQLQLGAGNRMIVMGYVNSYGAGNNDFGMLQLNINTGNIINHNVYGNVANDFPHDFVITNTNQMVIAGYRRNYAGQPDRNGYLVRTTVNGGFIWGRRFDEASAGISNEVFDAVEQILPSAGIIPGFAIGGRSDFPATSQLSNHSFIFLRTNNAGFYLPGTGRMYGGTGIDIMRGMIRTNDDGFAMVGTTTSFGNGGMDILLIKIDFNGNLQWARTYGGAGTETLTGSTGLAIQEIGTGGYIIAGTTNSFSLLGDNDAYLIRTDVNGFSTPDPNCETSPNVQVGPIDFTVFTTRFPNAANLNTKIPQDNIVSPPTIATPQCYSCFADTSSLYLNIGTITYGGTDYIVWPHKVYVSGTVSVTGSATLDISESDIVFSPNGEIVFSANSMGRINNSVLRPCNKPDIWLGIDFTDQSSGLVHETLIKQAEEGLYIDTEEAVKITNNEFMNCQVGIEFNAAGFTGGATGGYEEGVTGNTFYLDNQHPDYSSSSFFGIQSFGTPHEGIFGQNDFVYSSALPNTTDQFTGIFLDKGQMIAISNTFTNVYRAVDVNGPSGGVTIEDNEIDYSAGTYTQLFPIRVTNNFLGTPVLIEGNELSFTTSNFTNAPNSAIFLGNVSNIVVSRNLIEGFNIGISVNQARSISIIDNVIQHPDDGGGPVIGIDVVDGNAGTLIIGNYIRMNLLQGDIGIRTTFNSTISSYVGNVYDDNCIYDTEVAMQFDNVSGGTAIQLPLIRNNYMYNYSGYGILSNSWEGVIGTSCASYPTNVSKNSFVSNFLPPVFGTAFDIAFFPTSTFGAITATGNSSNLAITFPSVLVNTSCNTSSTVACGNHIGNGETGKRTGIIVLKQYLKNHFKDHYPFEIKGYQISLASNYLDIISKSPAAYGPTELTAMVYALGENASFAEMDKLYNAIMSNHLLSGNDLKWLTYAYFSAKEDLEASRVVLDDIQSENLDETEKIIVEQISLDYIMNGKILSDINYEEKQLLRGIDDRRGMFASDARDLLQLALGEHDYIFPTLKDIAVPPAPEHARELMGANKIQCYPNPAVDQLVITYFTENYDQGSVRVYDVVGKLAMELSVNDNDGIITLDISGLKSGVYLVRLVNENNMIESTKFVKQ